MTQCWREGRVMQKVFDVIKHYPGSLYGGRTCRAVCAGVQAYCMFIGYPRSGHSLVGALLDAHPNMAVSYELGDLKYILAGYTRLQLYYLILKRAQRFRADGCRSAGYRYAVPNQWQGTYERLRVIGDKHGEGAVLRLRARPWLLDRLRATVGVPVKFIHVVRNPYDNISTISRKNRLTLPQSVACYFSLCRTVADLKARIPPGDIIEITHEAFVRKPGEILQQICVFLGVAALPAYVADCASIVAESPRKTKHLVTWTEDLIVAVREQSRQYSWFDGYEEEILASQARPGLPHMRDKAC